MKKTTPEILKHYKSVIVQTSWGTVLYIAKCTINEQKKVWMNYANLKKREACNVARIQNWQMHKKTIDHCRKSFRLLLFTISHLQCGCLGRAPTLPTRAEKSTDGAAKPREGWFLLFNHFFNSGLIYIFYMSQIQDPILIHGKMGFYAFPLASFPNCSLHSTHFKPWQIQRSQIPTRIQEMTIITYLFTKQNMVSI